MTYCETNSGARKTRREMRASREWALEAMLVRELTREELLDDEGMTRLTWRARGSASAQFTSRNRRHHPASPCD